MAAAPPPASPSKSAVSDNLSLKVIRLNKSIFNVKSPLLCEPTDAVASALTPEDPFGISQLLALPSTFGKLFIGEIFSSYISINNGSTTNVTSVAIKVALQTPSGQIITLLEVPGSSIPVFAPGDSQDFVISQEIVDQGTYILVCSAGYVRSDAEKKHFRKFFQFEVEHPLQITHKTHQVQKELFAEVQIKNVSVVPLFLEKVEFTSSKGFKVESLNEDFSSESPCNKPKNRKYPLVHSNLKNYLKSGQIQQYLYKITELEPEYRGKHTLGHVNFEWRSSTSGSGKLETTPIKRVVPRPQDFQLEISDLPKEIRLDVPFQARCKITNCSMQKLSPRLCSVPEKQIGIAVNGVSGCSLPKLAPGDSYSLQLSFFPLWPGIQSINGLRIIEQQFDKKFDFDKLVEVFVHSPQTN